MIPKDATNFIPCSSTEEAEKAFAPVNETAADSAQEETADPSAAAPQAEVEDFFDDET